jgi:DNA primase
LAFPPQFLDEIRSRLACSEVIGKRVRLIRKGREYSGLCPFHNEKTPSFTVNDDKGFFHCFGCGAHGDVIGFAMRIDNLQFLDAVEQLAGLAGLEMPRQTPMDRARAEQQKTLVDVVEAACAWYEAQLWSPAGRIGMAYFKRRGLDDATIRKFRLGYAPDGRTALRTALKAQGIPDNLLLEAGLLVRPDDGRDSFDFFRARVMFPIMDRRSRPIAFGGRVIGDGEPKYLNSRDTPLFDKGRTLYALDKAREGVRLGAELMVAEGYMDVIALHAAGFTGAVAPLGTAITEAQIETLWKLAPEPVLCLDGDAAGQRAALRAADRVMPLLKAGYSLRFATLPAGEDPDSLIQAQGATALKDILGHARPLVDVVWESETAGRPLDTPERRAALEQRLNERIKLIPDRSTQENYRGELIWTRLRGRRKNKKVTAGSGLRAPGDVDTLHLRQAQVLLATAVNHPFLIVEDHEALAEIDLPGQELDRLRREVLNVASRRPDLDSSAVKDHLETIGLAPALASILNVSLYKLWPFAGPAASAEEAREGWKHVVAMLHRQRMGGEVDAAREALGRNMTDEALARVDGLQRQMRQADELGDDEPVVAAPSRPPDRAAG